MATENPTPGILPYLTSDLPGAGGAIKRRAEDFRVEEIPSEPIGGRGRHACFLVTKRGLTTAAAARRIARFMGVRIEEIGFAGLKDSQAVASQWMSLPDPDVGRLKAFRDRQVRIERIGWRPRRLGVGDLAGNRFVVRVRDAGFAQLDAARAILDLLVRRGVPNYFGPQRFGSRGDNSAMGELLLRGELEEFLRVFLGRPCAGDPPDSREARKAYDRGDPRLAMRLWPKHCMDPRAALAELLKRRGPAAAVRAIDPHVRRLYVEAFQSDVFNDILARRIGTFDRVLVGDIVEEAATGRISSVDAGAGLAALRKQAEAFRVSPTGLLPGRDARMGGGEPGRIERAVLAERRVTATLFARPAAPVARAGRRALRFRLADAAADAGSDRDGPYLELAFTTPPGCYATVVTEEVCKTRQPYSR